MSTVNFIPEEEINNESSENSKKFQLTRPCITRSVFVAVVCTTFILGIIYSKQFFKFIATDFIGDNVALAFFTIAGLYIISTILLVPGSILTLLAGFLFARALGLLVGILVGSLCVSFGSVTGATCALLLGRKVLREWVLEKLQDRKKFIILMTSLKDQGFKLVLLLRLSPILPFNLLNYLLSVTHVKTPQYVLASFLGMIPGTIFYVYLGATAASLSSLGAGKAIGKEELILLIVGGIFTLFLFLGLFFFSKRLINRVLEEGDIPEEPNSGSTTPLLRDEKVDNV